MITAALPQSPNILGTCVGSQPLTHKTVGAVCVDPVALRHTVSGMLEEKLTEPD